MSFILALEALKFYKLKQERLVQILFLLCFGLNALSILFPLGDTDFSNLSAWMNRYLTLAPNADQGMISYPPALSGGNLLFLASQIAVMILNLFFSYFYAAAYSAERDGLPAMKGVLTMFRSLPKQLLLLFLLIIPAFFSMFMLLIPLIVGSMMILFVPLLIAERRQKIGDAINSSYQLTKNRKFYIFFSFVLIGMFVSVIESICRAIAGSNQLTWILLASLIAAVSAMMRGRLIGLTYVFFAKQLRYISLQQFFNRNPQEAMRTLLGREEEDSDHNSDN